MEKISINGQIFNLTPMGISITEKARTFIITSNLSTSEIETAFSNVDRIEYLSETNEILEIYLDGVDLKSISKNMDDGTYTVKISIDAVERRITNFQEYIDDAICELSMLMAMMGGF